MSMSQERLVSVLTVSLTATLAVLGTGLGAWFSGLNHAISRDDMVFYVSQVVPTLAQTDKLTASLQNNSDNIGRIAATVTTQQANIQSLVQSLGTLSGKLDTYIDLTRAGH